MYCTSGNNSFSYHMAFYDNFCFIYLVTLIINNLTILKIVLQHKMGMNNTLSLGIRVQNTGICSTSCCWRSGRPSRSDSPGQFRLKASVPVDKRKVSAITLVYRTHFQSRLPHSPPVPRHISAYQRQSSPGITSSFPAFPQEGMKGGYCFIDCQDRKNQPSKSVSSVIHSCKPEISI